MTDVTHVHEVKEALHSSVFFPGHPPRRATKAYEHTHHQLIYILDKPCEICGVKRSTLADPACNVREATFMETHHYPIQDSLADACDWRKVHQDFVEVVSEETFALFVDSARNMKVLCSECHVGYGGIHNTSANYWVIQRYLLTGYHLFDEDGVPADVAAYTTLDQHLEDAALAALLHEAAAVSHQDLIANQGA